MEKNKNNFWLGFFVGLAVVSVICFLGLLIFVFSQGESVDLAEQVQAEQPTQQPPGQEAQPAAVPPITDDEYVKGSKDAKVVLIEYSDFECPYCAKHTETMNQVISEFGDQIAVVFRHFPLSFHANAQKAAEAAECAGLQGKFWEMHDELFELNEAQDMGVDQFKAAAKDLGLNTGDFDSCLDSGQMASKIAKDMAGAQRAGVSGTPGTFVNGDLISGALPFEQFKGVIDQLLAE